MLSMDRFLLSAVMAHGWVWEQRLHQQQTPGACVVAWAMGAFGYDMMSRCTVRWSHGVLCGEAMLYPHLPLPSVLPAWQWDSVCEGVQYRHRGAAVCVTPSATISASQSLTCSAASPGTSCVSRWGLRRFVAAWSSPGARSRGRWSRSVTVCGQSLTPWQCDSVPVPPVMPPSPPPTWAPCAWPPSLCPSWRRWRPQLAGLKCFNCRHSRLWNHRINCKVMMLFFLFPCPMS